MVNLGEVTIAGFRLSCRVTGVDDGEGGIVPLQPEREVPDSHSVY